MSNTSGFFYEDLTVGQAATFSKTITEADIASYAALTGDTNPIHLDPEFARTSIFKARIAHGMLSAGLISTIFGTRLPGPGNLYQRQSLRFVAPVRIGDTAVAQAEVVELIPAKKMSPFGEVRFATIVKVGDAVAIEGEASLLVPMRGFVQRHRSRGSSSGL